MLRSACVLAKMKILLFVGLLGSLLDNGLSFGLKGKGNAGFQTFSAPTFEARASPVAYAVHSAPSFTPHVAVHSAPAQERCTQEVDDVWEEKCQTVYEDKCTVETKYVFSVSLTD